MIRRRVSLHGFKTVEQPLRILLGKGITGKCGRGLAGSLLARLPDFADRPLDDLFELVLLGVGQVEPIVDAIDHVLGEVLRIGSVPLVGASRRDRKAAQQDRGSDKDMLAMGCFHFRSPGWLK